MISQLPVDEQLDAFQEVLSRNEVLAKVLSRSASLGLPGWYLTAGCLLQTVWNAVTSRAPGHGIKDYDLFYFDAADLSWEAEDAVIRSAKHAFADIPAEVEIRNEARVRPTRNGDARQRRAADRGASEDATSPDAPHRKSSRCRRGEPRNPNPSRAAGPPAAPGPQSS